jgi:anthranilate synthase component 1
VEVRIVAEEAQSVVPELKAFTRLYRPGRSLTLRAHLDADTETPISAFMKVSRGEEQAFLFESVEGGERFGRWSFLGARPRRTVRWSLLEADKNPLEEVARDLGRHEAVPLEGLPPFAGGWVGYLSYDAVRLFEPRVPASSPDELGFPDVVFMDFDTVVAFDNLRHSVQVLAEVRGESGVDAEAAYAEGVARIKRTLAVLKQPLPTVPRPPSGPPVPLSPRMSRAEFEAAVRRAKAYLRAGDCQQIVLSQRFDAEVDLTPLQVYRELRRVNPSPYLYCFQDGQRALVGSSPETLVRVDHGEVVVRPIAGTRRRGKSEAEDLALEADLRADPKENAEHIMLVDLGRNDVGRVAEVGTVRVETLKAMERYSHVLHMVSQVRGRLAEGQSALEVLRAAFPAGTVSGAPKVRAMEIIDALEPCRRGPYAGCIGYLDRSGNLEMAITIRTLFMNGRRISAQAGAGIVYDSVPAKEYEETLNKARAVFTAVARAQGAGVSEAAGALPNARSGRPVGRVGKGRKSPARRGGTNVVVIDNYDSYTYNLVQYLGELGVHVQVFRNDAIDVARLRRLRPNGLLLSPGPCTPDEAGVTLEVIEELGGEVPILGVCLGHQAIGQAYGGRVIRNQRIIHGKPSDIVHRGRGIFQKLPSPLEGGRYHSLVIDWSSLPKSLEVTAWTKEREIMGVRHRTLDVEGVQFHPESVLTHLGKTLLENWVSRLRPWRRS